MPESTPNTFQGGLNMDLDPRLQPKGTYRDANNIKVLSTEGNTFTIENIKGTTEVLDTGETDGNIPVYITYVIICSICDMIDNNNHCFCCFYSCCTRQITLPMVHTYRQCIFMQIS